MNRPSGSGGGSVKLVPLNRLPLPLPLGNGSGGDWERQGKRHHRLALVTLPLTLPLPLDADAAARSVHTLNPPDTEAGGIEYFMLIKVLFSVQKFKNWYLF